MPLISLYAIARDEEESLPGMIESVQGIVDEIVIVDTGSTDKTVDVARAYTDKVFRYEWKDSFAEARNSHLDKCTGDWIVVLDCDERMQPESRDKLKAFLETVPDGIDLVLCSMDMCRDDGTPYQEFQAERIFRNGRGIRWQGDMHNWLEVDQNRRLCNPDIHIIHNRGVKNPENRERRSKQRLELAEKTFIPKIDADPHDRRSMFYLAGTYFDSGIIDKSVEWFEKYLVISDWDEERYQAGILLAQCYCQQGKPDKAKATLSASLAENWRRGEGLLMLGQLAYQQGDYTQAEWWHKLASLKPVPVDPLFVEVDAHTWEPHVNLWMTYRQLGDNVKAAEHGRQAIELGAPNVGEILKFEKQHTLYESDKIAVLVDRGQLDFIQPVIDYWLAQGKEVRPTSDPEEVEKLTEWADIIWCEWAGDLAVKVTSLPKRGRIVIRVHGYETHSGHLQQVNFGAVDDVIFVARYLKDLTLQQCPGLDQVTNCYVVPGGVETAKFTIGQGKTGKKLCTAAYGNAKKNFPLALQVLAALPKDYEWHCATDWQDDRQYQYAMHMVEELGLQNQVFWYPWQENLDEFYRDKDYYLSTSIEESFCYSLAEGMSAGLKPIIHCWRSADNFYEPEWIFRTVSEGAAMIEAGPGDPEVWRNYAVENLDIARNRRRIDRIIKRPGVSVMGTPRFPGAFENKVRDALEAIGCRTDDPEPDLMLVVAGDPNAVARYPNARKVLWHTEQALGEDEVPKQKVSAIRDIVPLVEKVFTTNPQALAVYESLGAKSVEYLSSAAACGPFQRVNAEKKFDVGFSGVINERRKTILDKLGEEFDVAVMDSNDHEQLNLFYNTCRVVLNLHYTDEPNVETRVGEVLSAGAFLVTEPLAVPSGIPIDCYVDTLDLADAIRKALAEPDWRESIADRGYKWIHSRHRLERQVERLVERCGL